MQATPLVKGATTLRALGHGEMVSLALAYLESQITAMRILSPGSPPLVSQEELTERVRRMSESELLALLMPISALGHSD